MAETAGRHVLSAFDAALGSLRDHVLMMASLTQRNLDHARRGLFQREDELCNNAIADDEEIDALEIQMDRDGMALLMRFQPVASDLRVVIATMKLSVNLERLSDLVVHIARRARKLITKPALAEIAELEPLFDHVTHMLDDAIKAFSTGNFLVVESLKERDAAIWTRSHTLAGRVTQRMSFETGDGINAYLEIIFILRYLEQIGHLITNLGEDVLLAFSRESPSPILGS